MTTYKGFVNSRGIRATVEYADSNPNMEDSRDMNHWRVILRCKGKQLTVPFSTGYGISGEPTAADVLSCLASDASSIDNASSFEDWAADFGYDTDSRKAERTFKACERQAAKLRAFLDASDYQTLLTCEE